MSENKQIPFQNLSSLCEIPIQWQRAQKIYIPKVSTPSDTKLPDFRAIAPSPNSPCKCQRQTFPSFNFEVSRNSFDI